MTKLPRAEQCAWAADIAAVACEWRESITGAEPHTSPAPTNVMLVFNRVGRLVAWSATFANFTIAKTHTAPTATLCDRPATFIPVEQHIRQQSPVTRYFLMLAPATNASYIPFTIER